MKYAGAQKEATQDPDEVNYFSEIRCLMHFTAVISNGPKILDGLPLNLECLLVVATSIHSLLSASACDGIRAPISVSTGCQVAVDVGEAGTRCYTTIACERATDNPTLALR